MADKDNLQPCILLVDDEEYVLESWKALLEANGLANVLTCCDSREVLETIGRNRVEVVVLDLLMPHLPGEELLSEIRNAYPDVPVIVVTGRDEVSLAVECMKLGAFDYLVKTVEESRFVNGIRKAFEIRELHREHNLLKNQFFDRRLKHPQAFAAVLTRSEAMLSVFLYIEAIAASTQPVLITGETGAGKDLLALVVHNLSGREGAFLAANVAGFDDSLFSDTLFGHKKGAFTGAVQERKGLVEQAAEGTLFLDEIGDLSVPSQVKLLRLLEAREYYPIGSDTIKRSSARVVLATNRDLPALVSEGGFRKDLFYRLSTHRVQIPPLRARKEDIPLLVDHFLAQAAAELDKKAPTPPPQLYTLLSTYDFPGNVRELKSLIFDAVSRHRSGMLCLDLFRDRIGPDAGPPAQPSGAPLHFSDRLPTLELGVQMLIDEALERSQGNHSIAAQLLGLSQQALSKRLSRRKKDSSQA
jgi:DNA-binding NtrC family response regulator